jgi:hypothetical protein
MAARYVPTASEIEAFNRDLTRYSRAAAAEGDTFTARDLRTLAEVHWPGRNVRVKASALGLDWVESNPEAAPAPPSQPAGGPAQTQAEAQSEPATPEPLVPFSDLPDHIGDRYRHKLAMLEDPKVNPWGAPRPGGYVPDGPAHGMVYDGRGNILQGGPRTLTDEAAQAAQAALAAVPKYGQDGWQGGKRQALDVLGKAGGQRAPLSPEKAAKLRQAEAELAVEARAAFMAGIREREAAGNPVTSHRELGAIAEKHGHRL